MSRFFKEISPSYLSCHLNVNIWKTRVYFENKLSRLLFSYALSTNKKEKKKENWNWTIQIVQNYHGNVWKKLSKFCQQTLSSSWNKIFALYIVLLIYSGIFYHVCNIMPNP